MPGGKLLCGFSPVVIRLLPLLLGLLSYPSVSQEIIKPINLLNVNVVVVVVVHGQSFVLLVLGWPCPLLLLRPLVVVVVVVLVHAEGLGVAVLRGLRVAGVVGIGLLLLNLYLAAKVVPFKN